VWRSTSFIALVAEEGAAQQAVPVVMCKQAVLKNPGDMRIMLISVIS
jgi:hypothetical protein